MGFNIRRLVPKSLKTKGNKPEEGRCGPPEKLPLSGSARRKRGLTNRKKSSNHSHSTGSKTGKTSLETGAASGTGASAAPGIKGMLGLGPSWEWERLESDIVRRMSSADHHNNPAAPHLRAALPETVPQRSCDPHPPPKMVRATTALRPHTVAAQDRGFRARQKKWLEVSLRAIKDARHPEEMRKGPSREEDVKMALAEHKIVPLRNVSDLSSWYYSSRSDMSGSYWESMMSAADLTADYTTDFTADDQEDLRGQIRSLVSSVDNDDMSATSVDVLMRWLGCYDSFDESEYGRRIDPTGMIVKSSEGDVYNHRSAGPTAAALSPQQREQRRQARRQRNGLWDYL